MALLKNLFKGRQTQTKEANWPMSGMTNAHAKELIEDGNLRAGFSLHTTDNKVLEILDIETDGGGSVIFQVDLGNNEVWLQSNYFEYVEMFCFSCAIKNQEVYVYARDHRDAQQTVMQDMSLTESLDKITLLKPYNTLTFEDGSMKVYEFKEKYDEIMFYPQILGLPLSEYNSWLEAQRNEQEAESTKEND